MQRQGRRGYKVQRRVRKGAQVQRLRAVIAIRSPTCFSSFSPTTLFFCAGPGHNRDRLAHICLAGDCREAGGGQLRQQHHARLQGAEEDSPGYSGSGDCDYPHQASVSEEWQGAEGECSDGTRGEHVFCLGLNGTYDSLTPSFLTIRSCPASTASQVKFWRSGATRSSCRSLRMSWDCTRTATGQDGASSSKPTTPCPRGPTVQGKKHTKTLVHNWSWSD